MLAQSMHTEKIALIENELVKTEQAILAAMVDAEQSRRVQREQCGRKIEQVNIETEARLKPLYEKRVRLQTERQLIIQREAVPSATTDDVPGINNQAESTQVATAEFVPKLHPKLTSAKSAWFDLLGRVYRRLFGGIERGNPWHPLSAPYAHARSVIGNALKTANDILIVSSHGISSALVPTAKDELISPLALSPRLFRSSVYSNSILGSRKFDLIVCDFGFVDLQEFRDLFERLRMLVAGRGKVVVFHLNEKMRSLDSETYSFTRNVFPLEGRSELSVAGSVPGALAMKWWHWAVRRYDLSSIRGSIAFAIVLGLTAPLARFAYWLEVHRKPGRLPRRCTSITIDIDLP